MSMPMVAITTIPLTSCGNGKTYDVNDYVIDVEWNNYNTKNHFNILQLTDLHISDISDKQEQFDYLTKVVEMSKLKLGGESLDFIVVTGDLFNFANKQLAKDLLNLFEGFKIPWTCCFGNHDEQNYFSIEWLTNELNNMSKQPNSYCKFKDIQDDDVYGNCNFVINIKNGNNTVENLFVLDSNRYRYYGTEIGYDYVRENQVSWYKKMAQGLNATKSLAFMHIPLMEFNEAYEKAQAGTANYSFVLDDMGIRNTREKSSDKWYSGPRVNTHLYDQLKGHCQAMFVAHAHESDYCVKTPDGITLGFGIKSTNKVYCDPDRLGGQIIQLSKDGTFALKRVIVKY